MAVYPKVRVREEREEADQYAYEKGSLKSLKAFEWLSLHHSPSPPSSSSTSDESSRSVVRIPHYVLVSPPPGFVSSKEEKTKKKNEVGEGNRKGIPDGSASRPRAVLSSPDNDTIIDRERRKTKRQLLLGLKDHNSCHNRHIQCKIFPRSAVVESFVHTKQHSKEPIELKGVVESNSKAGAAGQRRKIAPAPIQS